jgi:hypothetical protein
MSTDMEKKGENQEGKSDKGVTESMRGKGEKGLQEEQHEHGQGKKGGEPRGQE